MQDTQKAKITKAVKLTREEKQWLARHGKKYSTQEDAATSIGIKVGAYCRISELGRGNSINVAKIRTAIAAEQTEQSNNGAGVAESVNN